MFILVAFNIPAGHAYTYSVPSGLAGKVEIGCRVLAPLGKRKAVGFVISEEGDPERGEIKDILSVIDPEPLFGKEELLLYSWAADYYLYPLGKLIKEIVPGQVRPDVLISRAKAGGPEELSSLPEIQQKIIMILNSGRKALPARILEKRLGERANRHLHSLQRSGWIRLEETVREGPGPGREKYVSAAGAEAVRITRNERRFLDLLEERGTCRLSSLREAMPPSVRIARALEKKGVISISEREAPRKHGQDSLSPPAGAPAVLTSEQVSALAEIAGGISSGGFKACILHGVTGSGKTEVYLQAAAHALARKGGVLFLVPEIALTPQLLGRIQNRFDPGRIAVMHSGIPEAARADQWRRIQKGELDIVVGARSAVFAPVRRLRLIIVDEEHDSSYKQEDRMRYNARDLAVVRAAQTSSVVVLGSATPSVQTLHNVGSGKYSRLELSKRIEERPLPEVQVVDMKGERDHAGRVPIFSRALDASIREALARGKQSLLFLNRRGSHPHVFCCECGHVLRCSHCSVPLTHHADSGLLVCHYCGFSMKALPVCPGCGGTRIGTHGFGTERLEKETAARFPEARIARMDSDTVARAGSQAGILKKLDRGEIDVLIGTQMIAKGHDFPNVILVGVVSADLSLNIPDFRAAERTFQILMQVAGRSGRGDTPGKVVIQTFNPDHYAIKAAEIHDHAGFYERELSVRKPLLYPPFSRLVSLEIAGPQEDRVRDAARKMGEEAKLLLSKGIRDIEILGPAEAPVSRIKGKYRWRLLLKGGDRSRLREAARRLAGSCPEKVRIDVDPLNFM
ncbi:MAG: primosomal protein N' [Syntrophales bacterium]|nr:primosomal protein N' [Syntrophales bacterium]